MESKTGFASSEKWRLRKQAYIRNNVCITLNAKNIWINKQYYLKYHCETHTVFLRSKQ